MAKTSMAVAELLEKGTDADLLREMRSFVARRPMEAESRACAEWPPAGGERSAPITATAIATGVGGRELGTFRCASRSCVTRAIFRAFRSRAGRLERL